MKKLAWFGLAVVSALVFPGCKGGSAGTTSYVCVPPCPGGSICAPEGCVVEAVVDLAVPQRNDGGGCDPACSGATPYCNASSQCVPCLEDKDCPLGQVCATLGASAACISGCTDDSRCPAGEGGGADSRCCNGQCLDVSSDAQNCGGCGNACESTHAVAACVAGVCGPGECVAPWTNCNQDPSDGCETNLHSDPKSCGSCGTTCTITHALGACAGGGCYIGACQFGFDDCNGDVGDGCETSVLSDSRNCGGCGLGCTKPAHASVACVNASCQLTKCDVGFADCDHNSANGCEVSVGIDKGNCGACGNACPQGLICTNGGCTCPQCNFPNAKSQCVNNQCALLSCVQGFEDCNKNANDGCEVSLTDDALSCGACGNVCPMMTPSCINGVCAKIQCMRIGWKFGMDNWTCPQGYGLPTVNDWNNIQSCITNQDVAMFADMHDVAVSVGGCNCKWNNNWCGQPSIETIRGGRMCGDYNQLHICVSK